MICQDNSIVAGAANTVDHSTNEGYAITLDSTLKPTIVASATAQYAGVITQGRGVGANDDIALPGSDKIVHVRCGGACTAGTEGVYQSDGTFIDDPGTGARRIACLFLKSGVSGDLVPAKLYRAISAT